MFIGLSVCSGDPVGSQAAAASNGNTEARVLANSREAPAVFDFVVLGSQTGGRGNSLCAFLISSSKRHNEEHGEIYWPIRKTADGTMVE